MNIQHQCSYSSILLSRFEFEEWRSLGQVLRVTFPTSEQSGHSSMGDDSRPRGRFLGLSPGLDLSSTHADDPLLLDMGPSGGLDEVSGGWVVKSGGSWRRHMSTAGTWAPMPLPLCSLFSFFLLSSPIVLLSLLLLLHPADPELQAHVYLQVGLLGPLITGARAR